MMKRTGLLMAILGLMVVCLPGYAQEGPPGQGAGRGGERPRGDRRPMSALLLPSERAEAAWKLEAEGVARGMGLSEANTTLLVEAYSKARKSYAEAARELRPQRERPQRPQGAGAGAGGQGQGQGQGDPGAGRPPRGAGGAGGAGGRPDRPGRDDDARAARQEEMRKLLEAEKAKLQSDLAMFLEGDQLEYAGYLLGTFHSGWDRMVDAIARFELGEEKTFKAIKHIEAHIAETAKLRIGEDREAVRRATQESRDKMLKAMEGLLDEQQMARFRRIAGGRDGARGGGLAERLLQFDKNGDGKIQESEVPEPMLRIFDRLDANGDGELDQEEMDVFNRGRGGQGGRGRGGGAGGGGAGGSAPPTGR